MLGVICGWGAGRHGVERAFQLSEQVSDLIGRHLFHQDDPFVGVAEAFEACGPGLAGVLELPEECPTDSHVGLRGRDVSDRNDGPLA